MSSVDDRIVNMQFNNKQFTQGAADSLKALNDVESAVAKAGKNNGGMDSLGKGVDQVAKKFSILEVTGVAALGTLVAKATSAGIDFVKNLTLGPIQEGFQEYAKNLSSTQTILANTGRPLREVNDALLKLNQYSDSTVYNFGQMAQNIGRFTAAGVKLKPAVAAIKGMANSAALAGATTEQLNSAMYQMSQALSTGVIKLMDWNSLSNANMGTKNMQESLKATAMTLGDHGAAMEAAIAKHGNFRDSLTEGWLTARVFTKTMKVMGGQMNKETGILEAYSVKQLRSMGYTREHAKRLHELSQAAISSAQDIKTFPQLVGIVRESMGSLWAQTFSGILGNFNQSKKLWTQVGKVVTGQVNLLNEAINGKDGLVTKWAAMGGRNEVIAGFKNIFVNLGNIISQFKKAFKDVFPPGASKNLFEISEGFRKFTQALMLGEGPLEDIRDVFGGFFAVIHIGLSALKAVGAGLGAVLGSIFEGSKGAGGGLLEMAGGVGRALKELDRFLTQGGKMTDVMQAIGAAIGSVVRPILKMASAIVAGVASLATGGGFGAISVAVDGVKESFYELVSIVSGGLARITGPMKPVSDFFTDLASKATNLRGSMDEVTGTLDRFSNTSSTLVGSLGDNSKTFTESAKAMVGMETSTKKAEAGTGSFTQKIIEMGKATQKTATSNNIVDTMEESSTAASAAGVAMDAVGEKAEEAESKFDKLKGILAAIGGGIAAAFGAIGDAIGWAQNAFSNLFGGFDALDWASVLNALLAAGTLLTIQRFFAMLDRVFDVFGMLDEVKEAVVDTLGATQDALTSFQQAMRAKTLMFIGIAIGVLAASLFALAFIPVDKLGNGLAAITSLVTLLVGSLIVLSKSDVFGQKLAGVAGAFLAMGTAILILSGAIAILAQLDPASLWIAIGAVTVLLGVLTTAITVLGKQVATMPAVSAGILAMAFAIGMLVPPIVALGLLPFDVLAQGLGAVAIALGVMTTAMVILGKNAKSVPVAAGAMIAMAFAIGLLVPAIAALGNMDLGTLIKGLLFMGLALGVMVGALLLLSNFAGQAAVSAGAILALAFALQIFVGVMLLLGVTPWDVIGKGLLAVGIALGVVLLAGALAMVVAPGLYALAAALTALGFAMLAAGAGMFLFGAGFALLAAAGTAGIAVLMGAISAFIALLPAIAIQIAAAFVSFLEAIAEAAPRIQEAMVKLWNMVLGTITDALPALRDLIIQLMNVTLDVIDATIPRVGKTFTKLIQTGLKAIRKLFPDMVNTATDLLQKFLDRVEEKLPDFIESGKNIIISFIEGIGSAATDIVNAAGQAILDFLVALEESIDYYAPQIRDAGIKLMGTFLDAMTFGISGKIGNVVSKVAGPLTSGLSAIGKGIGGLLGRASVPGRAGAPTARTSLTSLATTAINQARPYVTAIMEMAAKIIGADPKTGKVDSAVVAAVKKRDSARNTLDAANLRSAVAGQRANKADAAAKRAERLASRKNATKAQKAAATAARRKANALETAEARAQKAAEAAQKKADAEQEALDKAIAFRDADNQGKGDMLTDDALAQSDRARFLLARANERKRLAAQLAKTDKRAADQLLRDAKKDADAARAAAEKASALRADAAEYYAKTIDERIKALKDERDAEKKRKEEEAELEAAETPEAKAVILNRRAAEAEERARIAEEAYLKAIADAEASKATDAAAAMAFLDQAEKAAGEAKKAADEAEALRDQAEGLLNQNNSVGGGSVITPSADVLAQASSAVDSFTESQLAALEAAQAGTTTIEFNQNNYSPEALSPSEVYRQTKSLINAVEVKMTPA